MKFACSLWLAAWLVGPYLSSAQNNGIDNGIDYFAPSRNPFRNFAEDEELPQFVLLSMDDPVTEYSMLQFRPLVTIRDRYGCGIKATFFTHILDKTSCDMIDALRQGGHEIAANTYNDVEFPSREEIEQGVAYLTQECNVPLEEIKGFRAPGLKYTQETWDIVNNMSHFVYDSSLVATDDLANNFGRNHLWPWTMTQDLHPALECTCERNKTNPGLWEIPISRHYDSTNGPMFPMDYPGDPFPDLSANFERHYNGNRAPFGIHFHLGWLLQNNFNLKRWIEKILDEYNDVHFITYSELVDYMRNPVRKRRFRTRCTDQASECYTPLPIDCIFGTFNPVTCGCDCQPGYCTDSAKQCKVTQNCGDIDGGWSGFRPSGICCDEQWLLERECTNPTPSGSGKDCNGTALMVDFCYPESCVNDGWSDWGEWSKCCEGQMSRTRECLAPPTINGGRGCLGAAVDTKSCEQNECRNRYYPNYSRGACDLLPFAPTGFMTVDGNLMYEDCCGEHFPWDLATCIDGSANPPIHGGWSDWSKPGPCCGSKRVLVRTCTNPAPAFKGDYCEGSDHIEERCETNECGNGGWSDWSEYGQCCDRKRVRTRVCLAPPETGCEGESEESIDCEQDECVKTYSPNFSQQICARVYDGEQVIGTADLTYNTPETCCQTHFPQNFDKCISNAQVPVDGGWGEWSSFGVCCNNVKYRYRACNRPTPVNGGRDCEGPTSETESCFPNDCGGGFGDLGSDAPSSSSLFFMLLLSIVFLIA